MPIFNGDGPGPAVAPEDPAAQAMVNVSSGDSSEEKEGGSGKRGLTPRQSQGLHLFGASPALSASL